MPSDFVGRPGRKRSKYDIQTSAEVLMCRFERAAFERFFNASPTLVPRFLEMTMDELDAARNWMLLLGRKTARERLASFFELLALRAQPAPAAGLIPRVELPLSREETANYLGLTLETVSRQLS